ncbi:MAG: MerR family transcriptional regulator [Deltaproteobacteria bacterium]|nr:MerR family transcriptional regulator [Deltaproteobacteria bacterium]
MKQQIAVPNKLYFRIGEVADLLTVKPYVLRYWETEFPDIRPCKSKSGQRRYKRKDVQLLVQIKDLLYGERFTINGARKRLKEQGRIEKNGEATAEQISLPWQQQVQGGVTDPAVMTATLPAIKRPTAPVSLPAVKPPVSVAPQPVAPVAAKSTEANTEHSKIFAKIKKDLEIILAEIKS